MVVTSLVKCPVRDEGFPNAFSYSAGDFPKYSRSHGVVILGRSGKAVAANEERQYRHKHGQQY